MNGLKSHSKTRCNRFNGVLSYVQETRVTNRALINLPDEVKHSASALTYSDGREVTRIEEQGKSSRKAL